jgi:hypothetical protein
MSLPVTTARRSPTRLSCRETLEMGKYLRLRRGDLTWEAYITRVAHTIVPFGSWPTNLLSQLGTGFLERNKYSGSPVAAEGAPGVYP